MVQPQRRVPFTASVGVAIGKRCRTDQGAGGVEDRRLAVGGIGVALRDRTGGGGDRGHRVLMVATERTSGVA